ncbi:MAG: tetratricopeptide repeat protein [Bacteroidia bacterium]|nr:tetratricopeptide repeat protein [Bacteroidia bacterium]
MKFLFLYIIVFTINCLNVNADNIKIDSLWQCYNKSTTDTTRIKTLLNIGSYYEQINNDSAIFCYKHSALIANKINNVHFEATALRFLGIEYKASGDYFKADSVLNLALKKFKSVKDTKNIATTYLNIGNIKNRQGKYLEAISAFQLSYNESDKVKDTLKIALALQSIGNVHYYMSNLGKAEEYYLKSLHLLQNTNNFSEIANIYNNLGTVYNDKKNYNQAIKCYKEAIKLRETCGNIKGVAVSYNNLGNTYGHVKKYDLAIKNYSISLDLKKKLNEKEGIAITLGNIASMYIELNKNKEALSCLNEMLEIANSINSLPQKRYAYEYFSIAYENVNDFKKALYYQKLLIVAKDSLLNEDLRKQIADINIKYETEKKEKQISYLINENKIKTLESNKKKEELETNQVITYWLLSAGIMLIVIIIFSYILVLYKGKQKRGKLEKDLIQYMQKAVNQQMNPHFIFNTLNSIQYYLLNNDKISSSKYISKFSKLMRLTLDNSQTTLIPLFTEIEALQLYLELEQVRYKNKFQFELIIDNDIDVESTYIPPLIIQPHIENAIWHGLMHLENDKEGRINVKFENSNNILLCYIEDNGIGRKRAEEIKALYKPEHKSLGTKITNSRIEIINQMFNRKIEINYVDLYDINNNPKGTKVEILFPFFSKFNNES